METAFPLGHCTALGQGPCTAALQAVTATPCFKASSSS